MRGLHGYFNRLQGGEGARYALRPQQFLNFFPLPQGQGLLRPTFGVSRWMGKESAGSSPGPSLETARARGPAGAVSVGASAPRRCIGRLARNCSKAIRFDVERNKLCRISPLMLPINS